VWVNCVLTSTDNLFDRFVQCATCAWPLLVDDDIKLFKALKNARDAIAHGSASEPPVGFARQAELLAHKVLWVQRASDALPIAVASHAVKKRRR